MKISSFSPSPHCKTGFPNVKLSNQPTVGQVLAMEIHRNSHGFWEGHKGPRHGDMLMIWGLKPRITNHQTINWEVAETSYWMTVERHEQKKTAKKMSIAIWRSSADKKCPTWLLVKSKGHLEGISQDEIAACWWVQPGFWSSSQLHDGNLIVTPCWKLSFQ